MKRTYIHKEGWKIVLTTFSVVLAINLITNFVFKAGPTVSWFVFGITFQYFVLLPISSAIPNAT
ncbi:MAG: hypothetical protein R2807_03075 [Chitinophagales bacterium]